MRVQYVLERRKALLIEVKGKIQGLFSLVYHFPEGYDLLDRVYELMALSTSCTEVSTVWLNCRIDSSNWAFANRVACIFWVPWKKFHVRVGAIS